MRKSRIMSSLVIGMLLFILGDGAWAYNFDDVTLVDPWKSNASAWSYWIDVVGEPGNFNTFGANLSGNTFTIFTNWNPRKDFTLGAWTADLFIDNDLNGTFDYAIRLDVPPTTSVDEGKVFTITTPNDYRTSEFFLSSTIYWYGGRYGSGSAVDSKAVPVWAISASSDYTSVEWTYGDGNFNNSVAVDLSDLLIPGRSWSFVWGTATCSNDAISGQEEVQQVPEPTTMLLLGLGLIGLAGLRRKKI